MEKVHSTTLIYRRCLDFNIQPQNQVFNTHELWKPSNLHPSVVFGVVFTYVAPCHGGFRTRGTTSTK
jgi:hypothetical protein